MKMFLIRKRTKNTSVSATIVSNSSPPEPKMNSPPPKTDSSSNRFSRLNQQTTNSNMISPSSPDLTGYTSNPEETKSYQSFSYSPSQQARSPSVTSPGGGLSHSARAGLRKNRQIQTFNLIVLGAKSTGKSTFVHTLIGSLTPSLPTQDEPPAISVTSTSSLSERLTSIVTLSGEKVMFNVIDTPGLDILSNDEFRADLQMNETLRYIESKFDDSLQVERQVHRNPTRLGDGHVHISIYFIDPSTITQRGAPIGSADNHLDLTATKPTDGQELPHMSAIDLRQLKRLSRRCNIMPVIGRADELTEAQLINIKNVVQTDMKSYGIDLGLFAVSEPESDQEDTSSDHPEVTTASSNSCKSNEDDEARKKLPRRKSAAILTPRRPFSSIVDTLQDLDGVCGMIPLSVIGAEVLPGKSMDADDLERLNRINPLFSIPNDEEPSSMYVRRFKWATVDVLNPRHCDFVLLRAVILGSHFKRLKEATRLEKYEKYRTEKLLARRITMNKGALGIEEQRRIAIEVEKMEIPHIEPAVSIFVPSSATNRPPSTSANLFKPSGWRKKQPSAPATSVKQPTAYPSPTNTENHLSSRHPSRSPPPEKVNNLPMVF